jgi:hypothetical protein
VYGANMFLRPAPHHPGEKGLGLGAWGLGLGAWGSVIGDWRLAIGDWQFWELGDLGLGRAASGFGANGQDIKRGRSLSRRALARGFLLPLPPSLGECALGLG